MNRKQALLLIIMAGFSPAALAMDTDYVVMGGFNTIVNAFTRLKLLFNDNQYTLLISAFAFMGAVSGLLFRGVKAGHEQLETGKGQMGAGWLLLTVIGTVVYFGLVQPKGTVHIYDQTRNQYQAVSGIPDIIIVTARLTNSVYQAFVDFSNRDTATTTRFTGEGTAVKMLMGLLTRNGAPFDNYLTDSVKSYWTRCEPVAEQRGFDPRKIRSGSGALDVVTTLSQLKNAAVYSVWYDTSNPSGVTVTCEQAYTNLKTALSSTSAYDARLRDICVKNGYTASNASQYADCKSRLEEGMQTLFGASGLSLSTVMSNVLVSQAISDALIEDNPEVAATMMANRAMVNSGISDVITSSEWLTTIQAGTLAIILTLTPMLILLVVTPMMGKALTLIFGLWVFITTWQIADVMLLQASTDEILTVMNEIKTLGLGIDAMQLSPTSAMKSMAVMGQARSSAAQIALLVSGIFGVSAFGLSGFGQRAMNRLERASDEVSNTALTPEGRGHALNDLRSGVAAQEATQVNGIGKLGASDALLSTTAASSASMEIRNLGGTVAAAGNQLGAVQGARSAGEIQGYGSAAGGMENAATAAQQSASVQTQRTVGDSQGIEDASRASGMDIASASRLNSGTGNTMTTADNQSNLEQAGGTLTGLHKQQKELHGTNRETDLGNAEGKRQAAAANGQTVEAMQQKISSVETSHGFGDAQGREDAAGGLQGVSERARYTGATRSDEDAGHADALHNAYGDNVRSGVATTQTESTKQQSADMGRQRDLVQEIMDKTGMPEQSARRTLSDAQSTEITGRLRAAGYDGERLQDMAVYEALKHQSQITGEQDALQKWGKNIENTAQREGEIGMHRNLAAQDVFDVTSNTLGGDKSAAQSAAGAGNHLALTPEQAKTMLDAGQLTPDQYQAVLANGNGSMAANITLDNNGKPTITGPVSADRSASENRSVKKESGYSVDDGATTGTANSTLNTLKRADHTYDFIKAANARNPGSATTALAMEGARALETLYSATSNKQFQQAISGGGTLSLGIPGTGSGLSLGTEIRGSEERHQTTNSLSGTLKKQAEIFVSQGAREADANGLTGSAKQEYVEHTLAQRYSAYFSDIQKLAAGEAMQNSGGTRVDDYTNRRNESQGVNDRPTVPDIPAPRPDGTTPLISAQEYAWQHREQAATPTASEKLVQENQQQTTAPQQTQVVYRTRHEDDGGDDAAPAKKVSNSGNGTHPPATGTGSSSGVPSVNNPSGGNGSPTR